jgi:hypothetical protein
MSPIFGMPAPLRTKYLGPCSNGIAGDTASSELIRALSAHVLVLGYGCFFAAGRAGVGEASLLVETPAMRRRSPLSRLRHAAQSTLNSVC